MPMQFRSKRNDMFRIAAGDGVAGF